MNNFIVERIINFNEFHIFTNKFSEINYLIKGNLSIFQDLIALICKATNCNPLYFYWAALFITGLVFSIGLITLFKELLPKDKFFAYIIPLFAFSIFMSHGSTSNLSWFLTSTIILMFSPFFLSWVISFDVSNKEEWVVFLLLLFILTLFHYYLGLIFGLILLFSIIISKYIKIKNYNIYLAIFSILVFIVSIFFLDKISGSFKIPFLPSDFKILKDKLTYLNLWTPLVILSLSLLGTIYLLIKNIKYPSNKINTFMTSFILFWGIFFLPLANIHRSGMFLYAFFAVVPFLFLCERLWINKVIKILIYSTIICLLFVSWIFATQNFLTTYSVQGVTSSFSNYDLDMGNWIKNNTSKDTIIIGESADQNIQSGISGRENVGGHQMADWRKSLLRSALIINDQKLVKNYICKIGEDMGKDRTIVIILSGRTFIFLNNDINSPIYLPTSITSKQIIDKFNNYSFIELKKQFSDQIYLFEVKCK